MCRFVFGLNTSTDSYIYDERLLLLILFAAAGGAVNLKFRHTVTPNGSSPAAIRDDMLHVHARKVSSA